MSVPTGLELIFTDNAFPKWEAFFNQGRSLPFNRTFLIGDSTSVLSQVKNKSILFKPFEQSRLRIITHLTNQSDFFHVKSQYNQSDILTRLNLNLTKEDLEKWVSGTFLTENIDQWPITGIDKINQKKDINM